MDIIAHMMGLRNRAEDVISARLQGTSAPTNTRVYDCGMLGSVVVTFKFQGQSGTFYYTFEWLAWHQVHTLNEPGLDLP